MPIKINDKNTELIYSTTTNKYRYATMINAKDQTVVNSYFGRDYLHSDSLLNAANNNRTYTFSAVNQEIYGSLGKNEYTYKAIVTEYRQNPNIPVTTLSLHNDISNANITASTIPPVKTATELFKLTRSTNATNSIVCKILFSAADNIFDNTHYITMAGMVNYGADGTKNYDTTAYDVSTGYMFSLFNATTDGPSVLSSPYQCKATDVLFPISKAAHVYSVTGTYNFGYNCNMTMPGIAVYSDNDVMYPHSKITVLDTIIY